MSTQSHAAVSVSASAAAGASSASSSALLMVKNHEEEEESTGIVSPELRSSAITPFVRVVTKQMQLNPPKGPQPKHQEQQQQQQQQIVALVPRDFHQHHYEHQHYAYTVYSPPLATHEELVQNKDLFFGTLTKFHVIMGTKLTIPKIGGKDLDLHTLYREVTARGGLQMVINERKWKEITVVLNFPRTTTSASFVLRKYYTNLLHHYEQVHFFKVQGPLVPPPVPPPSLSPVNQSMEANYSHPVLESPEIENKRRKIDSAQALGVDPASSIGTTVTGSIDGKCENAYLVTVMVGTRKMRGVLYHVPSGSRPQGAIVSGFMNTLETDFRSAMPHRIGCRPKRKEMSRKDPNAPRQNRTGYNFFFAEQRAKLKSVQPDKDRAISKMIGDLWNRLSEDEKSPYQERGLEDKERYKREMREYKEKLRLQNKHTMGMEMIPFQKSFHMAQKTDCPSGDSVHNPPTVDSVHNPPTLRVQDSDSLQEQVQHWSENCCGIPILEKLPSSACAKDIVVQELQPQCSPNQKGEEHYSPPLANEEESSPTATTIQEPSVPEGTS